MGNFRTIARELRERGAALCVPDAGALTAAVRSLLSDPAKSNVMASEAAAWHRENQGALDRSLVEIRRFLT